MNVKKWLVSVVLVGLFSQSFLWSAQYKMQTLYEKRFDTKIEDIVLDSYNDNGTLKFFPKIVVLKHLDTELSKGDYKYYKSEVRLLNSDGEIIKELMFPFLSLIGCSENGNYFYAWTSIPEKPVPYDPLKLLLPETKIEMSSFAVYNDKGEMLWKKTPYEIPYDVSPTFHISPKDGSVIACIMTDRAQTGEVVYDSKGHLKEIRTPAMCDYYEVGFCGFSENWNYIVALAKKSPLTRYEELPGKSTEPRVLLFDSLLNLVWERTLDEYFCNNAAISAKGSYIYVGGHTMAGIGKGVASRTGYLFDNVGALIMKIKDGHIQRAFSNNEKYLLIDFNPSNAKLKRGLGLIDIEARKILYRRNLRILKGIVASDGSVAVLGKSTPRAPWRINIYDKDGHRLLCTSEIELIEGEIEWQLLSWDGDRLIAKVTDKTQNQVNVLLLKIIRGQK